MQPQFEQYPRDSMLAESRKFFREILHRDLPTTHPIAASFGMLNQRMAGHYGIEGAIGSRFPEVSLPHGSRRGVFLTHSTVLKAMPKKCAL
jgi:hypothetical protein